jgi:hypothetical protein
MCTSYQKAIETKNKKGQLSSATFKVIFQGAIQFICCDLEMIYAQ